MIDRHVGYIVTLEQAVREDDAERGILNAIRMVKGVASVEPVIDSPATQIAEARARNQLIDKLWRVLRPDWSE